MYHDGVRKPSPHIVPPRHRTVVHDAWYVKRIARGCSTVAACTTKNRYRARCCLIGYFRHDVKKTLIINVITILNTIFDRRPAICWSRNGGRKMYSHDTVHKHRNNLSIDSRDP